MTKDSMPMQTPYFSVKQKLYRTCKSKIEKSQRN